MEVVAVAGCSMGALVGALHAAGRLDDYVEWVKGLSQLDVIRLLDPSLSAPGAIRAGKLLSRMGDLIGGLRIEDLPIPYTAVATDLLSRKEVWFQHGPVEVAVRASIAMPGVFTPVMLNGRVLVDGGIMDPVPVAPTASVRSDLTVAVDLTGERVGGTAEEGAATAAVTAEARPIEEWTERFRRSASQLLDRDLVRSLTSRFVPADPDEPAGDGGAAPASDVLDALPPGLGKFDVMTQSLEAMQALVTRYRMAGHPPDVLVRVPKDACRVLDFHRAEEMIELGRTLTAEALDRAELPANGDVAAP